MFNRDYDTLRVYKSIAAQFQFVRRHPNLSFKHHREVAALDAKTADELLDEAEP